MGMIRWKLKVVMADRDMSAKRLAELTGLSYGAIIKLRNETPVQVNVSTLTALCNALDCTPDELMEYSSDEN
ncbi:helix-turn-helix transcriptional regulator [Laspinema sp. D1]|uniref:Helix-turn-helix transcriptional regulator n=1 Tax=Laspinema palackyanum D2a TaxID=2953684 RepID=A0ABT2N0J7_9CYAN|nr:helix-turn-helix transcriptional regulator [Laspinema sp. D2a]